MEAYRTTCPDCGHIRVWYGYKTGLGKTQAQLEQMKRNRITCLKCNSTKAVTELDHTSDFAKTRDQFYDGLAEIIIKGLKEGNSDKQPR